MRADRERERERETYLYVRLVRPHGGRQCSHEDGQDGVSEADGEQGRAELEVGEAEHGEDAHGHLLKGGIDKVS